MRTSNPYLSPAKLNLMLKIIKRRKDGFHDIQSIFILIDLYDKIIITPRKDNLLTLTSNIKELENEDNLIIKIIKNLSLLTKKNIAGINIHLEKVIPMGAGLGGGSSNAATTIMAINEIFNLNLTKKQLIKIANPIGKDIPFFINGLNAFVEGTGNIFHEIKIPKQWYLIINPDVNINTKTIFNHKDLTRNSTPSIIKNFKNEYLYENDMQDVVLSCYHEVSYAYEELSRYGKPIMTGSGSCLYIVEKDYKKAINIKQHLEKQFKIFCVSSLDKHPMLNFYDGESSSG